MQNREVLRQYSAKYSDTLDEMLGIRSKEGNMIQKVALPKQVQLVERPTTRHGRNLGTIAAAATNDADESDGTMERWQRECEKEEKSDNEKEYEEEFNSGSNDAHGTEKVQKVETDNKNDNVVIVRKIKCPPAVSIGSGNHFQYSIDTSNDGQDSDQPITIVRQRNYSPGLIPNSLAIKVMKKQASQENLCGICQSQPMLATSRNKTNSELRKSIEKYSRTMTFGESPSPGKVAYEEWFREKLKQERQRRRKQKEKEEKEKKAREARRKEAERNYEIWKQRTDQAIKEKRRKRKEKAEALEKEKIEEMRRKKEEASKMFQAWKNDRLQRLSKERKQHIQNKENEELEKKREMETRSNEAQKAFNAWCKDNKIRNVEAQQRLLKSRKTEEKQSKNAKEYKEALAREAYDVWLQTKENERHFNESLHGRIMKFDEMSRRLHLIPWIPPSNIIPRQFIPTRIKRHQSVKWPIKSNQSFYKKFPSTIHRSKSALR
ncbi:Protein maph-9 [Dirofilaria immitis]